MLIVVKIMLVSNNSCLGHKNLTGLRLKSVQQSFEESEQSPVWKQIIAGGALSCQN